MFTGCIGVGSDLCGWCVGCYYCVVAVIFVVVLEWIG